MILVNTCPWLATNPKPPKIAKSETKLDSYQYSANINKTLKQEGSIMMGLQWRISSPLLLAWHCKGCDQLQKIILCKWKPILLATKKSRQRQIWVNLFICWELPNSTPNDLAMLFFAIYNNNMQILIFNWSKVELVLHFWWKQWDRFLFPLVYPS